ncbi:MAG TPA: acyl-CoA dehydrogenase, partial [Verrucomicrobia bacterium]|nr:acyl-CoA dehydrogenase [Verrucomicrobiota bacterium]
MDLKLTEEEQKFREDFRTWLKENLPKEPLTGRSEDDPNYWNQLRGWQKKLAEGGWAGVSWPDEFGGRGATPIEEALYLEELAVC